MRTTTDPYPASVESLATSLQGEVERLRYVLGQIHGRTYWYQDPTPLLPPGDIQLGVASSRSAALIFQHASSAYETVFQAGNATQVAYYTWPTALPTVSGRALTATTAGVMSWAAGASTVPLYIGSFTRDTSAASGTQAVTGVGFTPRTVVFLAAQSGSDEWSIGIDGGTGTTRFALAADDATAVDTVIWKSDASLNAREGGSTTMYEGYVSSFDADGFTITWTKTGSPTGTFSIAFLAIG